MVRYFTLEYWVDDSWYVGRLKEGPGVFSQGETLQELEENIEEAYRLMVEAEASGLRPGVQTKEMRSYVGTCHQLPGRIEGPRRSPPCPGDAFSPRR
jgi:predicted RNase H-like HicB family nuclease